MLFLFIFIFDLLGLQLFGYEFVFCGQKRRRPMCPPGVAETACPNRKDCYVACKARRLARG